jgi:hypothetical protein
MAITVDPAAKRLVLDSGSVTAKDIFRAWADWALLSDNLKYQPAFSATGGDDLGGGLSIPPYYFLLNGWRVRPMEANHALTITGNLFVDGGGVPVVSTLGVFQVTVNYTVPVQAQGISTSGGGGLTTEQAMQLAELWKLQGLKFGSPLVVTSTTRVADDVSQTITDVGGTVTVARA